ncbi:gluconate 2-dehydrogenase subunit 3 family protein [Sphingobium sp.]|uniref:gluconate 2-dehydrogenase subunit 3 family protein n=1 Tax=Sphingobium sp. TaxID=1912891 RepID=UPI0025FCDE3A|nr:gluconate 2-dehydrogenase subunit 3 family protein [Sphingobium sp.]
MNDLLSLDRRSLIQQMLALAGAGAAVGFSPAALAKAAARAKPYLSPTHFALVTAVADTIIPRTDTPGAIDAGVPATFDALIANWASPDRRQQLSQALSEIDALAHEKKGMGFAQLSATERLALLTPYDVEALQVVPSPAGGRGLSMMRGPTFANPGYGKLKELIVILYYISETGLTHELTYDHTPGEWLPSIPVTPDTRPTGGAGLF